jgi:hypothetical protein
VARLSKSSRSKLSDKQFAGPNRTFPVNDRAHAKAAIMDSKYASNPSAIIARAKKVLKK